MEGLPRAQPPCETCGCKTFKQHRFKTYQCGKCGHEHMSVTSSSDVRDRGVAASSVDASLKVALKGPKPPMAVKPWVQDAQNAQDAQDMKGATGATGATGAKEHQSWDVVVPKFT